MIQQFYGIRRSDITNMKAEKKQVFKSKKNFAAKQDIIVASDPFL